MTESAEPKVEDRPRPRTLASSALWTLPMALGTMIFLFGILIWVQPELLAYIVAAAFCAVGLSIMGIAWRMRPGSGPPRPGGRRARDGSYVEFRVDE